MALSSIDIYFRTVSMDTNIVIVEDLDEVREGLTNFIGDTPDLTVSGAFKSGEDALQNIPYLQPDIVIMDINLPDLSGIECINRLKDKLKKTQFMMFTVYENDEKVFDALKAGAMGYLLKNTSMIDLVEALKELHRGGSPMSANIARKLVNHFQHEQPAYIHSEILTKRETEILNLLSKGLLYKEIADQLSLSTGTVRQHIHNIYEKLHVQNRTEAINKAFLKK
jgi:DNA-binding NarL/FixJ family response regulator